MFTKFFPTKPRHIRLLFAGCLASAVALTVYVIGMIASLLSIYNIANTTGDLPTPDVASAKISLITFFMHGTWFVAFISMCIGIGLLVASMREYSTFKRDRDVDPLI